MEGNAGGRDSRTEQNTVMKGLLGSRSASVLTWVERRRHVARDALKGHLVELAWRTTEPYEVQSSLDAGYKLSESFKKTRRSRSSEPFFSPLSSLITQRSKCLKFLAFN